jgi:hypothetical protein
MDHGHRSACVIPRAVPLPSCIPGHDAWTGPPEWFACRAEARVASGHRKPLAWRSGNQAHRAGFPAPTPTIPPRTGEGVHSPCRGGWSVFNRCPASSACSAARGR